MAYTIDDIHAGDKVTVTRSVQVSSVDKAEGTFFTKDKRTIRVANRVGENKDIPKFDIFAVTPGEPVNWPPVAPQVWADDAGNTYHVLGKTNAIYDGKKNTPVSTVTLKKAEGIHLVFDPSKTVA